MIKRLFYYLSLSFVLFVIIYTQILQASYDIIDHDDTVRVSLYFYNTEADCDALVEALKTCTIENCIGIFF